MSPPAHSRHLNGVEVFRFNLPSSGPSAVTDFSKKPPEIYGRPFDKEYGLVMPLAANATRPGSNVLAVEVHNADHVLTDLKWVLLVTRMLSHRACISLRV